MLLSAELSVNRRKKVNIYSVAISKVANNATNWKETKKKKEKKQQKKKIKSFHVPSQLGNDHYSGPRTPHVSLHFFDSIYSIAKGTASAWGEKNKRL